MARLRTGNRRAYARQLGANATQWRRRINREGPWFRELIRRMEPVAPDTAALYRTLYRRGYPEALMRKDLQKLLDDHHGRSAAL